MRFIVTKINKNAEYDTDTSIYYITTYKVVPNIYYVYKSPGPILQLVVLKMVWCCDNVTSILENLMGPIWHQVAFEMATLVPVIYWYICRD